MPTEPRTEAEVIIENSHRPAYVVPDDFNGSPAVLVPNGWNLKTPPGWEPVTPNRIVAAPEFHDVESFNRYVTDFKNTRTRIFAQFTPNGRFVAIIDYHEGERDPDWCQHTASYTPAQDEFFCRWLAVNGKPLTQSDFALFLENNLQNVVQPPGADLLAIINAFEVDGVLSFARSQRLQDGSVKFQFQNTTTAKSGEIAVPTHFILSMPMFEGEEVTQFKARLRYRLFSGGELKLWFEIEGLSEARRESLERISARIATGTGITPLRGTP